MVEILKVVDECCRDLSVVDIGESSLRASGEAEELRRWSDGARALGDAGGWLVVTLVPFAVFFSFFFKSVVYDHRIFESCNSVPPVS